MFLFWKAFSIALVSARLAVGDGLNYRAHILGRYFGTAMNGGVPPDKTMNAIATNVSDFGQYTCEYQMKWSYTEPRQNNFVYTTSDIIVSQALANGMIMRCHTLVWHQSLPSWVTGTKWDNATLISIMENHIQNVMTHYKGKCYAWDVVNEALYSDGTYRGSSSTSSEATSIWYTTIGPAYIPIAFAAAAQADPAAKLYYNDYDIEIPRTQSKKVKGVINLVNMVRRYGATIDGIGLQGHFTAATAPSVNDLVTALSTYIALGVEVAFTELDIKSPVSSPDRTGEAIGYANAVSACLLVPRCVGWTTWGFTEKYSWLTSNSPPYEGDLWDSNGTKTLSYTAALNAI